MYSLPQEITESLKQCSNRVSACDITSCNNLNTIYFMSIVFVGKNLLSALSSKISTKWTCIIAEYRICSKANSDIYHTES